MGENCCKFNKKTEENEDSLEDNNLFEANKFIPYDPSQEPIFPPELKLNDSYDTETLYFTNSRGVVWYRPTTMEDLLKFKQEHPEAKIVNGNTEIGVEIKVKKMEYFSFVDPALIKELNKITFETDGIKFGSSVTLTKLDTILKQQIEVLPKHETRLFNEIEKILHYFGGQQIRNVASIAGNIMTASPISDLNPIFLAANVELVIKFYNINPSKIFFT